MRLTGTDLCSSLKTPFQGAETTLSDILAGIMLPEITARLRRAVKQHSCSPLIGQEMNLGPRPLSEIEHDWLKAMLSASIGWENADISKTSVARTEPNTEGMLIVLDAPTAENPRTGAAMNSYAQIWIETADQLIVNVLLHEWKGRLQNLYVGVVDPRRPRRRVNTKPELWIETNRKIVGFGSR